MPALAINVAIILIPGLLTIAMAFFEWDGASTPAFVGLDNFRTIFTDPVFFSALFNNIKWTVIFLTIPIAMGLGAGALLLVARRGRTFFQVVYFLPVIIDPEYHFQAVNVSADAQNQPLEAVTFAYEQVKETSVNSIDLDVRGTGAVTR